jgi:hypothetical protein
MFDAVPPDGEWRGQFQGVGNRPADERHNGVLSAEPSGDSSGHAENGSEVIGFEGHAHAEHDQGEAPNDGVPFEPGEPGRMNEGQCTAKKHPKREEIRAKVEETVHETCCSRRFEYSAGWANRKSHFPGRSAAARGGLAVATGSLPMRRENFSAP